MEGARPATEGDLPRLAEVLHRAVAATPERRGGRLYGHPYRRVDSAERLQLAVRDEARFVVAGEIDGYVVGVAIAGIDAGVPRGPVGVVEEMYVEPEARSVGIGESILDLVVGWCREQGCTGVDIPALPGDRSAKNLCERSGFSARLLVMHRSLRDDDIVDLDKP